MVIHKFYLGIIQKYSNQGKHVITVSIALWNSERWIRQCLDSVMGQSMLPDEVILLDNNSQDETIRIVSSYPSEIIKLHRLTENRGFAAAQNICIRAAISDWILVMNPDVVLERDFLKNLAHAIPSQGKTGMITGKTLKMTEDGQPTQIIDSTGVGIGYSRMFFDMGEGEKDHGQFDRKCERFGVSGCCSLFRSEMLKDVSSNGHYFDESLYMYLEDVDLCWRASRQGWKAKYVPNAIAYHKRRGTWDKKCSPKFRRLSLRNRYIILYKNETLLPFLLHLPFILLHEIALFIRIFMYPYLLLAYYDAFKWIWKNRLARVVGKPFACGNRVIYNADWGILTRRSFSFLRTVWPNH